MKLILKNSIRGLIFVGALNAYSQGQLIPSTFRIPDGRMPSSFRTKEMEDTFKLKPAPLPVTPFDPSTVQYNRNPYPSSRIEYPSIYKPNETQNTKATIPQPIVDAIGNSIYKDWEYEEIEVVQEKTPKKLEIHKIQFKNGTELKELWYDEKGILIKEKP